MTGLPAGWAKMEVESLSADAPASLTDGPFGSNLKTSHYTRSGPRVIRLQNIGDGTFLDERAHISQDHFDRLRKHEAIAGDVVIAMLGEGLPRACIVPSSVGRAVVKADCVRMRVHRELSTPAYVTYALNSPQVRTEAAALVHGVGRPRLGLKLLRTLEVPVAPLPEQYRVVEAIDSYLSRLDDAVATLERVQRNLERYRASLLKAAVEGRLVPTEAELARAEGRDYESASVLLERILAERRQRWEEAELANMKAKAKAPKDDRWKARYQEPAGPDSSSLPELPHGWCWTTLSQLGELSRGRSRHRPRNDPRLLGGPYPFIQTGDVRRSEGAITGYSATYSEFGLAQSRLWPAETLCITIAANIAETGILKFEACFPDSVVGFLSEDGVLVRFVELFFRTAREELRRYAPATAQKNINLETLSSLAIPLPPRAEQLQIVSEADRLLSVAINASEQTALDVLRAASLRQSILKWAFEGRLVDQDPADEPASALLERIAAERDAAMGAKHSRNRATDKARARRP